MLFKTADDKHTLAKFIDLFENGKTNEIQCIVKGTTSSGSVDQSGLTLLHLAARYNNTELIDFLLNCGHDIEGKTTSGLTPLMTAATHKSYDAAKHLLDANADVLATDSDDLCPLRLLLEAWRELPARVVASLRERLRRSRETAANKAQRTIERRVVDEVPVESLQRMFKEGSQELARLLLDCDVDVRTGRDFLSPMFQNPRLDVPGLLARRWPLNEQNRNGYTMLHYAVLFQPVSVVRHLLDLGANANIKNRYGATALFCATDPERMELLLQRGADVLAKDNKYNTMVTMTRREPSLLRIVVARLADRETIDGAIARDVFDDDEVFYMYRNFRAELGYMKEHGIGNGRTLYSLLRATDGEVITYGFDNRNVIEEMLRGMRDDEYNSYFVSRIERQATRAFGYHPTRLIIAEAVAEGMGLFDANHLVIEKIVGYLTIGDIFECL